MNTDLIFNLLAARVSSRIPAGQRLGALGFAFVRFGLPALAILAVVIGLALLVR